MPQPAATAASAHGGRRRATAAHRKAGSHAHKEWHKARRHPRATCSWRAAGTVLCCRETGQRGRRERPPAEGAKGDNNKRDLA